MNQIEIQWIPKTTGTGCSPTSADLDRGLIRALRWVRSSRIESNTSALIICCSAKRKNNTILYNPVTGWLIPWDISTVLASILAIGVEHRAMCHPLQANDLSTDAETQFTGRAFIGLVGRLGACSGTYKIQCPASQITWSIQWGSLDCDSTECTELRIVTERFRFTKSIMCVYQIPNCSPIDVLVNIIGKWKVWEALDRIMLLNQRRSEAKGCLRVIHKRRKKEPASWAAMRRIDGEIWDRILGASFDPAVCLSHLACGLVRILFPHRSSCSETKSVWVAQKMILRDFHAREGALCRSSSLNCLEMTL